MSHMCSGDRPKGRASDHRFDAACRALANLSVPDGGFDDLLSALAQVEGCNSRYSIDAAAAVITAAASPFGNHGPCQATTVPAQ